MTSHPPDSRRAKGRPPPSRPPLSERSFGSERLTASVHDRSTTERSISQQPRVCLKAAIRPRGTRGQSLQRLARRGPRGSQLPQQGRPWDGARLRRHRRVHGTRHSSATLIPSTICAEAGTAGWSVDCSIQHCPSCGPEVAGRRELRAAYCLLVQAQLNA